MSLFSGAVVLLLVFCDDVSDCLVFWCCCAVVEFGVLEIFRSLWLIQLIDC